MPTEAKQKLIDWTTAVKERDGYKCQICGETKQPNAHHVVDKKFKEFKFDIVNGITLCAGHHKFKFLSAHLNPLWFMLWYEATYTKRYAYLQYKIMDKMKEIQLAKNK